MYTAPAVSSTSTPRTIIEHRTCFGRIRLFNNAHKSHLAKFAVIVRPRTASPRSFDVGNFFPLPLHCRRLFAQARQRNIEVRSIRNSPFPGWSHEHFGSFRSRPLHRSFRSDFSANTIFHRDRNCRAATVLKTSF